MEQISMSEAKSRFSEFVSRAAGGERFMILRRERPLAVIIGADELARLENSAELTLRLAQSLGQSPERLEAIRAGKVHPLMAAYGLWQGEEELDQLERQIAENRSRYSTRPPADL